MELALTEVLAWALIAAGGVYWLLASRSVSLAAVSAALAALVVKATLLDIG